MFYQVADVAIEDICSAQDNCKGERPGELHTHHEWEREDPGGDPILIHRVQREQWNKAEDKAAKACAD